MRLRPIMFSLWIGLAVALLSHCGVKGDPLPPLQPHVPDNVIDDKFGDSTDSEINSKGSADEKKDN